MLPDYEKLGTFYLGKGYDLEQSAVRDDLLLFDAKDLTTHALIVGMTGSGKTGLGVALLEEAAIDGIPALIIDPKGDLGNLLLTFPGLKPADFEPWIDPAEAARAGCTVPEQAKKLADRWKKGLADWDQPPERISRFRDAADVALYTPGGSAGLPLTVLRSFNVPPQTTLENPDALREAVGAAAASLLGLMGIEADALRSRENILLANIVEKSWRDGKSIDMAGLIRLIQQPPFDRVGVIDLESFFPAKERFEFSMQLNNLLASPGFTAWMEGEPLDIQRLLYTPEGKPRLAILSIAHLSDAERMFFVTILLSEVINWMRAQPGTSSLRALLYMDEVFGYFPPSRNPPSKTPMLTLLKQARAFGLGVVLATQNPVDLDYKGLANCGAWFLGRLQTERDKLRVLDGLEGASVSSGSAFNRAAMEKALSGLGNRVFLMNNVHDDQPTIFQTRWALSYLRGPLSRAETAKLMAERRAATPAAAPSAKLASAADQRPVLPPEIAERFVARRASLSPGCKVVYRPQLFAAAKAHYTQTTLGVDQWEQLACSILLEDAPADDLWSAAEIAVGESPEFVETPEASAAFAPLPAEFTRAKQFTQLATALKDYLYRNRKLSLWKCAAPKQVSQPGESEADFRVRLGQSAREQRDLQVEKLRQKFAPKLASLQEQRRKAEQRVEREKTQASQQTMTAALSFGSSLLSAFLGRKLTSATNVTRAASSIKAASKIFQQNQDVSQANESVGAIDEKIAALEQEFEAESKKIEASFDPQSLQLEELQLQPKKTDLAVGQVLLVWRPYIQRPDGLLDSDA